MREKTEVEGGKRVGRRTREKSEREGGRREREERTKKRK